MAFTGVSGSGKSSLIFDTLYMESYRRFSDASQVPVHLMGRQSPAAGKRPRFRAIKGLPPALGLSQRQGVAGRLSTVGTISGVADLLRVYFAAFGEVFCKNCDIPLRAMSFLDVMEAMGKRFSGKKIVVLAPIAEKRKGAFADELERFRRFGFTRVRLNGVTKRLDGDPKDVALDARKLNTVELIVDAFELRPERAQRAERAVAQAVDIAKLVRVEAAAENFAPTSDCELYNLSSACPQCGESAPKLDPRHLSHTSLGKCSECEGRGGFNDDLPADLFPCTQCNGSRLDPDMPTVRIQQMSFESLTSMTLQDLGQMCARERSQIAKTDRSRFKVLDEIIRLSRVHETLGVSHLTLGRSGGSLSPGDLQRLRLASLLSNQLQGAVYVLDEPCQGLTKPEVDHLLSTLRMFVASGSSVVVVEHHPDFLRGVDRVFVMGPGAGERGGEIVAEMPGHAYDPRIEVEQSRALLANSPVQKQIPDPLSFSGAEAARALSSSSTKSGGFLRFQLTGFRGLNAKELKLQERAVNILRGPSGSGKASFVELVLIPQLTLASASAEKEATIGAKMLIDEKFAKVTLPKDFSVAGLEVVKPGTLVRSTRRSLAAALDILVPLRSRFENLVSSQILGLTASDFSWHSKKGQCRQCSGKGFLEFEQKYAPPIEVICSSCNGAKLDRHSLVPKLKGKNFAEILDLTVEQAIAFFESDRQIRTRLEPPLEFGLGYLRLNQTMESLSGGEMQRLVLTLELKRARVDGFWYLLTHPGTGLHLPDIQVLGNLLRSLVNRGATFVLTENREEFAEYADHVIEFDASAH